MSAELLRRAADRLDALALAATPGPWVYNDEGDEVTVGAGSYVENPGTYTSTDLIHEAEINGWSDEDDEQVLSDAHYIATMHPGVGKALAAWLRDLAEFQEAALEAGGRGFADDYPAFAVARAVLGEDT